MLNRETLEEIRPQGGGFWRIIEAWPPTRTRITAGCTGMALAMLFPFGLVGVFVLLRPGFEWLLQANRGAIDWGGVAVNLSLSVLLAFFALLGFQALQAAWGAWVGKSRITSGQVHSKSSRKDRHAPGGMVHLLETQGKVWNVRAETWESVAEGQTLAIEHLAMTDTILTVAVFVETAPG